MSVGCMIPLSSRLGLGQFSGVRARLCCGGRGGRGCGGAVCAFAAVGRYLLGAMARVLPLTEVPPRLRDRRAGVKYDQPLIR
jgi:hypothetical protein